MNLVKKTCLAIFGLVTFSIAAQATPGHVLMGPLDKVLRNTVVCIASNPSISHLSISVYCNGALALQVQGFEQGLATDKATEEVKALSVVVGLMAERGFNVINPQSTSSSEYSGVKTIFFSKSK